MNAFITGIGWVNATNKGGGRNLGSFEMVTGALPEIKRSEVFSESYPHFGRLDQYSRLGIAAIAFAMKDASLDGVAARRPIGIIASTVHGCLATDIDYFETVHSDGGNLASPHLFAYTLPNSYLGEAAIKFGLTGPSFTLCDPSVSNLWCIRFALMGMANGQFEKVLGGTCDVGTLPPYSGADNTPGGALFFVIEKTAKQNPVTYGALSIDKEGNLAFNGDKVENLVGLVQNCLAVLSGMKH